MTALSLLIPVIDKKNIPIVCFILAIILGYQIFRFLNFVTRTNKILSDFLTAIKNSDFSRKFPETKAGKSFNRLNHVFNDLTETYKNIKIEKEAQFFNLEVILKNLYVGVITISEENKIMVMNDAACKILGISPQINWQRFENQIPVFYNKINAFSGSGNILINEDNNGIKKQLSVSINRVLILNESIRIITFKDIRTELDRKEVESWHSLISILRHEITNSVTPISSLIETIILIVENNEKVKNISEITQEDIEDIRHCALTIQARSNGLYKFVENYRELTKIPVPKPEWVVAEKLFTNVTGLLKSDIERKGINLKIKYKDKSQKFLADPILIEQVMINLVKNSIEALDQSDSPEIILSFEILDGRTIIEIRDNGCGIEEETLEEIFVPFYSTKEDGSGIGLSLSKQIIQLHNGNILVQSTAGIETVFTVLL